MFGEELQKQEIKLPNYISFQSRFGPKEWLQPYTADVLQELIDKGIKKLIVITPGFAADCIETLEEVNIEYKELFLQMGVKTFLWCPA